MRNIVMKVDYPFFNCQHVATLLGPVFGCSSPAFGKPRDSITDTFIEKWLEIISDDIISSFTYGHCILIDNYKNYIESAKNPEGIKIFCGLTCDEEKLERHVEANERVPLDKVDYFQLPADPMLFGMFVNGGLPRSSITINTPDKTAKTSTPNILVMLPNDMKQDMMF